MLTHAVTTVWCTELGATLLDGFNSTTVGSAYFHYLGFNQSATPSRQRQVPLRYGPAARERLAFRELRRGRDIGQNITDNRRDLVFRGLLNVVYDNHSDVVLLWLHFEAEFPNGIQGTDVAGVG